MDNIEIAPEYVYLTIPSKYVCVYHKILTLMADTGKEILNDCSSTCKAPVKNVVSCWNMFQSAIACHALGKDKQADLFINYITKQIDYLYGGLDQEVHNNSLPVTISKDGKLKAIVSCGTETKFYVDSETGALYQQYLEGNDDTTYKVENNNLIANDNGD